MGWVVQSVRMNRPQQEVCEKCGLDKPRMWEEYSNMVQFNFQVYEILLIFAITLAGLVWFMFRKEVREPSKLKTKTKTSSSSHHPKTVAPHEEPRESRPLNVNFKFENYTYDAYHVLDLPGGSSLESVQKAYGQSLRQGKHSRDCVQMAFEALKKALS